MKYFLFVSLLFSAFVQAQQLRVDSASSFITYEASHPVHDWSGTSTQVQGVVVLENDLPSRIAIATSVSSFDSKNSNRDAHALEVLEALLFPKVSFYSDNITATNSDMSLTGSLTFHGVSLPITTMATWSKEQDYWILEGSFDVSPSSFKVELPSFMLVKMRDHVRIRFRLELRTFAP